MSATVNEDAVKAVSNQPQSNDPGWFRSHVTPTKPMTDKGVSEHSAMSKMGTGGLISIGNSLATNIVLTVSLTWIISINRVAKSAQRTRPPNFKPKFCRQA